MTSLRARKLLAAHRRIACCCSRLASNAPPKELKFSETAAYEGYDRQLRRGEMTIEAQPWKPTYYDTRRYQNSKLLSAIFSVIAVFVYFGLIRESSDLDDILNAPPHKLTSHLERARIKREIKEAKAAGKDTSLLEAELAYVDVKEAAAQAKFMKNRTY